MDWSQKIFRYCERGGDPSFWAEPLNALSNVSFLISAVLATLLLLRQPAGPSRLAEAWLVALLYAIGLGSFLFHTYATRWASIADTGPIGLFMVSFLVYALRRLLGAPWLLVLLGLAAFVAALHYAGSIQCRGGLLSAASKGPCLNGTVGYVPAFAALLLVSGLLAWRRHPAAAALGLAAALFLVSMAFRSVDWEVCELTSFVGHRRGSHFLWHLLNGAMLYVLVAAAIRHGRSGTFRRQPD